MSIITNKTKFKEQKNEKHSLLRNTQSMNCVTIGIVFVFFLELFDSLDDFSDGKNNNFLQLINYYFENNVVVVL